MRVQILRGTGLNLGQDTSVFITEYFFLLIGSLGYTVSGWILQVLATILAIFLTGSASYVHIGFHGHFGSSLGPQGLAARGQAPSSEQT